MPRREGEPLKVRVVVEPAPDAEARLRRLAALLLGPRPYNKEEHDCSTARARDCTDSKTENAAPE